MRAAALIAVGCLALTAAEIWTPPLGLDNYMPVPADNPITVERVTLGRKLFFDPILSRDQSISCADCHDPEYSFTDKKPKAIGIDQKVGTRRVPKLINRGYGRAFFWDGRIATLEEQVVQPIINEIEMDPPLADAVNRLRVDEDYSDNFSEAFGSLLSEKALGDALASYVRTIVSGDSAYDRYIAGATDALTPLQKRGLDLFRGKANCTLCHLGPNLIDEQFHNTGIGWREGAFEDRGRSAITENAADTGAFKTPTLRNVADSAPYMHDGSLATLEDVVEHYNDGGEANPHLNADMVKLELTTDETTELIEFLKALTGTVSEGLPQAARTN